MNKAVGKAKFQIFRANDAPTLEETDIMSLPEFTPVQMRLRARRKGSPPGDKSIQC